MENYDHKEIEKKWQKKWREEKIYKTPETQNGSKSYVLDMFPYPSGDGLHVGHPKGYIATDIYSRMKKMQGHNVLHPMGWDAFGLPAENYAIKNKIHPRVAVEKNIKRFKEQLAKIGFNYDWEREINTTDPEYYKWTQWIFLKMLEKGLAYESYEPINWCPSCQTGLANEDLEKDGTCERCGSVVEKKPMRQWVLKITDYAERLLSDLEQLNWPEYIKESQRNWIGKSEGMLFTAPVKDTDLKIQTFSAHFEAFCADTFVVIAPDHPFLGKLVQATENEKEVLDFAKKLVEKREREGYEGPKEPEGIFTGRYIVDPVGNGDLPIWVANYALADYGTGIVKCSAHDERDFAFAKKYNIPLKEVIEPMVTNIIHADAVRENLPFVERNAVVALVKHWSEDKYLCLQLKVNDWCGFIIGGIEEGEDPIETARREILEETGYKNAEFKRQLGGTVHSKFFHMVKGVNRFAHFTPLLFKLKDGDQEEISENEKNIHDLIWVEASKVGDFMNRDDMTLIWNRVKKEVVFADMKKSILTEPSALAGKITGEAREEIIKYLETNNLAEKKVTYRLKDWVFSRQRYWGEPIPVVHCEKCGVVPVPEKDLPVMLPEVENYEPTGTGESPLANIESWVNTTCPKCSGKAKRETNTMPQWAGSSWYYIAYCISENLKSEIPISEQIKSPEIQNKIKYWSPVDMYVGGAEHATRHLIYARFWHKFLFDIGIVKTDEPFSRLQNVGLILASDGRKMSKRYGNVVNPDDIVETWGADSLRLYEMFMGPFNDSISWNTDNMIGVRRFLEKVWNLTEKSKTNSESKNLKIQNLLHKTIKKITEDTESYKFNTAISSMMIFVNEAEKEINKDKQAVSRKDFETLLKLLAPFAPHMTEELWSRLDNKTSIHLEKWPKYNESKIKEEKITIVVQINGKVRASFETENAINGEEIKEKALSMPETRKWLEGKTPSKIIYVQDRLISIVV